MRRTSGAAVALAAVTLLAPARAPAQDGAGTAGAQVLQLTPGARAAALAGAYSAERDADALFFNPAGIAPLAAGASLSYQVWFEDISFGSAAGAYRVGPVVLGIGLAFLDAGEVQQLVPDPAFGGQRGMLTGEVLGATETAARIAAGLELLDGRAAAGAAIGFISSDLAGVGRSAPFLDLGALYRLPLVTLGASLRHLGGELGDASDGAAPLPAEARLGAAARYVAASGLGGELHADLVAGVGDGTVGFAAGLELGLLPPDGRLSAVARAGYATGGDGALAPLLFGAGVSLGSLAVDYAFQSYDFFGAVHRFGLRWTVASR